MTIYQILCLCGVSSLGSAVMGALITKVMSYRKENKALKTDYKHY